MSSFRTLAFVSLLVGATLSPAMTVTAMQTLTVNVSALSKLSVPASLTMTSAGSNFSPFTVALTMNYRARTTMGAGSAAVSAAATADFSPAGGPSVAGGDLTYTCGAATLGTACGGTQTMAVSSQTPVLTIPASACTGGGGACSASDPNTISIGLTLANGPSQSTGTYQTVLQFTTSAI